MLLGDVNIVVEDTHGRQLRSAERHRLTVGLARYLGFLHLLLSPLWNERMILGAPQDASWSVVLRFTVSQGNPSVRHLRAYRRKPERRWAYASNRRKSPQKFARTTRPRVIQDNPWDQSSSQTPHTRSSDTIGGSYAEGSLEIPRDDSPLNAGVHWSLRGLSTTSAVACRHNRRRTVPYFASHLQWNGSCTKLFHPSGKRVSSHFPIAL